MAWARFEVPAAGVAGWERGGGDLLAVVLHGGPGLSDYTEGLADEVFEGGDGALRVVRYQQRGQAPSTTEGPLTVAQLVADLVAVIDHFGAASAVVIGHSWGGHLAMHAAVAEPDRVAALLLIDSLGGVGDGGSGTMGGVITSRIGPEAAAELASLGTSGLTPAEMGAAQLRLMWPGYFSDPAAAPPPPPIEYQPTVGAEIMNDAGSMLATGVLEQGLPSVSVPALHLIARHSPIDPAANEKTAALMPDSVVEFADTGHFIWLEQPGAVTTATRRLLASMAGLSPGTSE